MDGPLQITPEEMSLNESVHELLGGLPPAVQDFLTGPERNKIVLTLTQKHRLHADQAGGFERAFIFMLLGIMTPEEFVEALRTEHISEETIQAITSDLNDQVFIPLRDREEHGTPVVRPAIVPTPPAPAYVVPPPAIPVPPPQTRMPSPPPAPPQPLAPPLQIPTTPEPVRPIQPPAHVPHRDFQGEAPQQELRREVEAPANIPFGDPHEYMRTMAGDMREEKTHPHTPQRNFQTEPAPTPMPPASGLPRGSFPQGSLPPAHAAMSAPPQTRMPSPPPSSIATPAPLPPALRMPFAQPTAPSPFAPPRPLTKAPLDPALLKKYGPDPYRETPE